MRLWLPSSSTSRRRGPAGLVGACSALLLACSSGDVPTLGGSGGPGPLPSGNGSGQTGSPQSGSRECDVDAECRETAEARVAEYSQPSALMRSFAGARCEQVGLVGGDESRSGPTCVCDLGDGGSLHVGPAGGDCQVRGRAGSCLWESFDGCDRFDARSCDAVCTDLEGRLAADAARRFDTKLVHYDCTRDRCRSVLSIDGECAPAEAVSRGKRYDCALGGPAILDQFEREEAAEAQPDPTLEGWPRSQLYADGTRGVITLGVQSDVWHGWEEGPLPYAWAQFCDTHGDAGYTGEVLDPLEGTDDCGVIRKGMWDSNDQRFYSIGSAQLALDGKSYAVELSSNNITYQVNASFQRLAPPYGASARFLAQGGGLTQAIDIPLRVPEALRVDSLEGVTRIERNTAHSLRWTGRGRAPLHVLMQVTPQLADVLFFTELECLLQDDGAFEIPAALLSKLPEGIATITVSREARSVETSAGQKFISLGAVQTTYHTALGARCDNQAVLDACKKYAAHQAAVYAECGSVPAPVIERTCPAYLAESCVACPAYFECSTKALRCENGSPTYDSGCSCPTP